MGKIGYSSVFRAGINTLERQAAYDDMLRLLRKYPNAFNEVIFFTQSTHSALPLEHHRRMAKLMEPKLEELRSLGLRVGVNAICSVGFWEENYKSEMDVYQLQVNANGQPVKGRICGVHPRNRSYLTEYYSIYASIHPDLIYVDDDLNSISCYCEECLARFSSLYPDITGGNTERAHLLSLLESEDRAARLKAREAWIAFNALRINEVLRIAEETVHRIDPTIEMDLMTHMCGSDGVESEKWAETLSGKDKLSVRWRPGGGVYTEFTPNEVLEKAHRISTQIRYLPQSVEHIESEIENFPYQSLKKSPEFTAFEAMTYLAAGCTGTAFNIASSNEPDFSEHEPFFAMAEESFAAGKQLTEAFGRQPSEGIRFAWNKRSATRPTEKGWRVWDDPPIPYDLAQIGFPIASDAEQAAVLLLNEDLAWQLTEEKLKKILSKGVAMDAKALKACHERGLSEYVGFTVEAGHDKGIAERDTAHRFNRAGCREYNLRQAFGWCGTAYSIKATASEAEYLTELCDLEGNVLGFGSGIYENKFGGRIAVFGVRPFDWCYSLPRTTQLKNVYRWLSFDSLPAYISSFHRLAVWARGNAFYVANFGMSRAKEAKLCLRDSAEQREFTVFEGGKAVLHGTIQRELFDGCYSVYSLPELPVIGSVLIQ